MALLLGGPFEEAKAWQDLWLTKAHDARRTGQSRINGPMSIDRAQSWTAETPGAHTLNIGATFTERGVFFGSWGLSRRIPGNPDPRLQDKSDGKLYGLDIATGASFWGGPLDLDLTARCYDFDGRGPNLLFCGLTPYEVSFYNGTVEGQAAVDTSRNVLYLGRGDGKRYTIDPGRIRWRYVTFNPELPDDPDGGGEVVTAPLLGPDGTVYFGTWGEGDYETHAFYAVNPDSTQLVLGIALREVDGQTQRLYVTTANVRQLNAKEDGMLHAVDPASGAVLANYDPSDDVPEAIGSINSPAIGANGTVYFGVRGRFGNNPVNAHYFAVTYEEAAAQFTRLWNVEVAGLVEQNHPAIGPDGGIYAASSSLDEQARLPTYEEGGTPEGTTVYFHAL